MATKKATKKATPKTSQLWNNVQGTMRVWANEREYKKKSFTVFSTSIGKKNDDGEYDNLYFDVLFKKNEAPEIEDGCIEINITKGFITLKVDKKGAIRPAVMVMEYETDENSDLPF